MDSNQIQTLITMILYICVVIGIGVYFAKRANASSENYYLGGRSLGPWIAAFSAEASDMSGWLLMEAIAEEVRNRDCVSCNF